MTQPQSGFQISLAPCTPVGLALAGRLIARAQLSFRPGRAARHAVAAGCFNDFGISLVSAQESPAVAVCLQAVTESLAARSVCQEPAFPEIVQAPVAVGFCRTLFPAFYAVARYLVARPRQTENVNGGSSSASTKRCNRRPRSVVPLSPKPWGRL